MAYIIQIIELSGDGKIHRHLCLKKHIDLWWSDTSVLDNMMSIKESFDQYNSLAENMSQDFHFTYDFAIRIQIW